MHTVIADRLWIGNAGDGRNVALVLENEISAVVHLAFEEPPEPFPREVINCRIPLLDSGGNSPSTLKLAIRVVSQLVEAGVRTMVSCSGGMSRSPAVVAAALAQNHGESPDTWLKNVAAKCPHDVAPALWNDVRSIVVAASP